MAFIKDILSLSAVDNKFYYIFPIALLLTVVLMKDRRKSFVIPVIFVSLCILNPWFYKVWDKLDLYAYWRIVWVVPIIPVCAALPALIAERIKNEKVKVAVGLLMVAMFALAGKFIYINPISRFYLKDVNTSKLPSYVVEVADELLTMDENPRLVADTGISVYIRQYTGKINTLYGRDIIGHIYQASSSAWKVNEVLNSEDGDMSVVADIMLDEEYDYLALTNVSETRKSALKDAGFEMISEKAAYSIYKVTGHPSVKLERDEYGRVVKKTYIDEDGECIEGPDGYAVVEYEYDENGYCCREFRTDKDGRGFLDSKETAGYIRDCDDHGLTLSEKYLDKDGKVSANSNGYAEIRYEYDGTTYMGESYYDEDGKPVLRSDLLYASKRIARNERSLITEESYDGVKGEPVKSSDGFARVTRDYDDNGNNICEKYYDEKDELVLSNWGYAVITKAYDDRGNVIEEKYFDEADKPVTLEAGYAGFGRELDDNKNEIKKWYYKEDGSILILDDGYSILCREYDSDKHVISESYHDANDLPIACIKGYSRVDREYDEAGEITKEFYFNTDGSPYVTSAGYSGIIQDYDEDEILISRIYTNAEGEPVERSDGYTEARWKKSSRGTYDLHIYDLKGNEKSLDEINLLKDGPDGWSKWMTPKTNIENSCFDIGSLNLGEKNEGDQYTCQIEIEFKDVTASDTGQFAIWTQGAADGKWDIGNIWNSSVMCIGQPPADGIYTFTVTREVSDAMIDASVFGVGFRCDYWASGSFRVRKVKIEKGDSATEWDMGL